MFKNDLIGYAKRHLLVHMRQAGYTPEQIEEMIANITDDQPLKAHFVAQYLERLPEDQRDAAQKRLERSDR